MTEFYKAFLDVAKNVQATAEEHLLPSPEITITEKYNVLPYSLFQSTRGYLEKVVSQINTTYEKTCYDACAVMIRRLVETLIIEIFEHHNISDKIKNPNGDFLQMDELINKTLSESAWNLSRDTKRGLKNLKNIGDLSAHSRRYNANRTDIDKVIPDLRVITEELLYLSALKR
jgi:hypothetical protein